MSRRFRALYCAAYSLARDDGGSLVCREHVQRLADLENVDLHVCLIGHVSQTSGSGTFLNSLKANFHPLEFEVKEDISHTRWSPRRRWPFSMENLAFGLPKIDIAFDRLVDQINPDVVIMDYLMTGLFIPSIFRRACRLITITLNREARFYGEMRRSGRLGSDVSNSFIAQVRFALFERAVYSASDVVVALSPGDVPKLLNSRVERTVIEPALDEHHSKWRYLATADLFFVGNIAHYPNYLAIKWLAEKLLLYLEENAPNVRIRIIGACSDEVPQSWKRSNVDYLGVSDKEEVERCFVRCNLFIAPIENRFGSKIKILQCLSHGTPVIATREALSGIPFAKSIPQFSLADPGGAARLVSGLIFSKDRLNALSLELTERNREFCKSRQQRWRNLLESLCERPVRSRFVYPWSPLKRSRVAEMGRPWPAELEIGIREPFWVDISGMYPAEKMEGKPLRWTAGISEIRVPINPRTLPKKIRVGLWGITPAGGIALRISANEVEIFRGQVRSAGMEETFVLPSVVSSPLLVIRIETPGFEVPGDTRQLGVAIKTIALRR
jgi:glycosyltransferase involved in cell wall biosynthesis